MAAVTERQVLDALGRVVDPEKGADIVSLGMVSGIVIRDGNVAFAIEVEPERGPRLEPLRSAAEKATAATDNARIVEELYLAALSRLPTAAERDALVAELAAGASEDRRQTIEDLYWSVLTSREFLFNH